METCRSGSYARNCMPFTPGMCYRTALSEAGHTSVTHIHTHTHTHTRMHVRICTHARTHTHTRPYTHTHSHTCIIHNKNAYLKQYDIVHVHACMHTMGSQFILCILPCSYVRPTYVCMYIYAQPYHVCKDTQI